MKKQVFVFFHSPALRFVSGESVRSISVGGGSVKEARAREAKCESAGVCFFHSPALCFVSGESVRSISVRGRFREGSAGARGEMRISRYLFFSLICSTFYF